MKKTGLKLWALLLILPYLLWAGDREGKYKKSKVISQTYSTGDTGSLYISNEYGDINVVSWNENTVEISATVTVDGDDADKVDERLDGIDVSIGRNGDDISAKTTVKSLGSKWHFFGWFSSNNTHFKIHYEVKMPVRFDLKIRNDYGNIYLNKLEGKLDLTADYGEFALGELLNDTNVIHTDYFKNSSISFIKNGEIYADYSHIDIENAYRLSLTCDYSHITIDSVRKLKFNNDYGSIKVNNANEISGRGDYQKRYFAGIYSLHFTGDYGSLKIEKIMPGFDEIEVRGDYISLRINNTERAPYQITARQLYGAFDQEGIEMYKSIVENFDKHFAGYYKARNSSSKITLNIEYGSIKILN